MSIARIVVTTVLFFGVLQMGESVRCYECVARLQYGETDPCLYGEAGRLPMVTCLGPSVCAAYHYQTVVSGNPTTNHITRGCQPIKNGATCEDIFHHLRRNDYILPGQHTCTTCSSDLCNSAPQLKKARITYAMTLITIAFMAGRNFLW